MNSQALMPAETQEQEVLLARQLLASLLADAFRDPRNQDAAALRPDPDLVSSAWALLAESFPHVAHGDLSLGELTPQRVDPSALALWLAQDPDTAERIYRTIFGFVVARDCPPYETEFCHWNDPTFRANQMADVAGFFRAFGLQPDERRPERVDHLSLQIDFVADLLRRLAYLRSQAGSDRSTEQQAVCLDALRAFLKDHLCWWTPTFAGCFERRVDELMRQGVLPRDLPAWRAFRECARILRAWIACERLSAGLDPVRQIISPQVAPLPAHDEEASCGLCDSEECASSLTPPAPGARRAQPGEQP